MGAAAPAHDDRRGAIEEPDPLKETYLARFRCAPASCEKNMLGRFFRLSLILAISIAPPALLAQGRRGAPQGPPPSGRSGAPVDLTGYWVSLVTSDWQYRMVPPVKIAAGPRAPESIVGFSGIPMNPAGEKVAEAWDPAKDQAAGEQCKAYGAGNIMRIPERIHITWEDDETMKLETDAGMQIRYFEFKKPMRTGGDWQGVSRASWEAVPAAFGFLPTGSLKVVTTNFKAGYLNKNGVPYSANALVTELFDRADQPAIEVDHQEFPGAAYLVVTRTVVDPAYLLGPYLTAVQFQKEPDGSKWNPTPCSVR